MVKEISIQPKEHVSGPDRAELNDEKLRKACKEFESVFTYELLKSMRRTIDKCDLFHGGKGEEIYESLLDQELSKRMAGQGPGSLSSILYRQLKKTGPPEVGRGASVGGGGELKAAAPLHPLRQGALSSPFGWRKDPFSGEDRFHHGADFAAGEGTAVCAPIPGKVIKSEFQEGYGNLVVLDHGHGLTTLYAHNQDNMVSEGDWVGSGDPLATVGSTGRSTGPHLHFEVRRNGRRLDPRVFLGNTADG